MPEIIINTSPLQYLYQLGLLHLLQQMYGRIIIPDAVLAELERGCLMGVKLPRISSVSWIEIKSVRDRTLLPAVTGLGQGEKEVLALALESSDALVVLDDLLARRYASFLRLKKTGTLGILLKAKQLEQIKSLGPILDLLDSLGFRLGAKTRNSVLRLAGETHEQ